MGWIKATKQLPELTEDSRDLYLVLTRTDQIFISEFTSGIWEVWHECLDCGCGYYQQLETVEYWQPIAKFPRNKN